METARKMEIIFMEKRLREIDRRIRYLTKRLESAQIVDPKLQVGLTQVFLEPLSNTSMNKVNLIVSK